MSKGYLRGGEVQENGTFAIIYIDDIDEISYLSEIDGCNVEEIIEGSMAYDKYQNIAVYHGNGWTIGNTQSSSGGDGSKSVVFVEMVWASGGSHVSCDTTPEKICEMYYVDKKLPVMFCGGLGYGEGTCNFLYCTEALPTGGYVGGKVVFRSVTSLGYNIIVEGTTYNGTTTWNGTIESEEA